MEMISYRTLLLSRQPGKFTEPEVTAIIQQILPQLEQIHRQNLSHNNINLDTIVTNQQQIFLLPSDYSQSTNPSKDIYDLGMAIIELLTGKYPSLMKAPDGSFNWDDYCTVSDQLSAIINRLITPNYYSHFRSATEALSEQPVLSYQPPTVVPPNLSQPSTVVPTRPSSFISSSQKKWKMPIWGWAIAGSVFVFAVGVAIALPNLLGQVGKARESQGMNGVGAIVHGQMKKYLETGRFYNSIEELGPVDMYSGKFYVVNMNVIDNNRVIITATPKEDNIRSYLGVVYLNGNQLISGVCRSLSPSSITPKVPDLSGSSLPCPSGSTLMDSQSYSLPEAFVNHSTSSSPNSNASIKQLPLSIGWMRLGSVRNTSGQASIGDQLISTSQPVTIKPSVVPSIGDQATIITSVNLRRIFPQSPNYKLAEKISTIMPNQRIVILRLESFTDPTSPSPYTIIWAEVGLP